MKLAICKCDIFLLIAKPIFRDTVVDTVDHDSGDLVLRRDFQQHLVNPVLQSTRYASDYRIAFQPGLDFGREG